MSPFRRYAPVGQNSAGLERPLRLRQILGRGIVCLRYLLAILQVRSYEDRQAARGRLHEAGTGLAEQMNLLESCSMWQNAWHVQHPCSPSGARKTRHEIEIGLSRCSKSRWNLPKAGNAPAHRKRARLFPGTGARQRVLSDSEGSAQSGTRATFCAGEQPYPGMRPCVRIGTSIRTRRMPPVR